MAGFGGDRSRRMAAVVGVKEVEEEEEEASKQERWLSVVEIRSEEW